MGVFHWHMTEKNMMFWAQEGKRGRSLTMRTGLLATDSGAIWTHVASIQTKTQASTKNVKRESFWTPETREKPYARRSLYHPLRKTRGLVAWSHTNSKELPSGIVVATWAMGMADSTFQPRRNGRTRVEGVELVERGCGSENHFLIPRVVNIRGFCWYRASLLPTNNATGP